MKTMNNGIIVFIMAIWPPPVLGVNLVWKYMATDIRIGKTFRSAPRNGIANGSVAIASG